MGFWHCIAMSVICARRYSSGTITEQALPIDGNPRKAMPARTFDWVGLADPAPAEMELVRTQFGLHPLAIEDCLNPTQRPKVEIYGAQLFIITRTAAIADGENIGYGQTAIFLGCDFIVTVRLGSTRTHDALRARLESDTERLAEGADYVAHGILDFVVDGYVPIIELLEEAVLMIEERAIEAFPEPSTIRRVFRLRRQFRKFQRIVGPMEEVCDRLATTELPAIDPGARVWFRDVLDHIKRTMARMDALHETLATVVETAGLLEQHRQGKITRQLAAWAAILAVPTAVAGIYGMNFDYMPELHQRWGYPAVLAAILAICSGLFVRFRRIGWL
jgi:magnesium transporter